MMQNKLNSNLHIVVMQSALPDSKLPYFFNVTYST